MQESTAQKKKSIRVPDLPTELFKDQSQDITYLTSNTPPFYSTTERLVTEKSNTDPNFLRSTMYTIPASEFSLECLSLPLSIISTPFSDRGTVEFAAGFDSCIECRTIFNVFTKTENSSYSCNICGKKTSTLPRYIENLGFSSFETVIAGTPVITKKTLGTDPTNQVIDYPFVKELVKPAFFFMFDLSSFLLVERAIVAILQIIKDENFQVLYENVGFFILNNGITAFSIKDGNIVRFRYKGESSFISPKTIIKSDDLDSISKILQEIMECPERQAPDHKSIVSSIKSIASFTIGCKIALFSSCSVNFDYEVILNDKKNICVNTFSLSQEIQKASKIGSSLDKLAFFSSGQIFRYSTAELFQIRQDIRSICMTRSVYDVNIVLKVSDNLVKKEFIGASLDTNITTAHMNHMDTNTAIAFLLDLDGVSKLHKYIQLQAYFTDFDGSRRLRVFNHSFPTGTPMQVFSNSSFDTIFTALVKQNLSSEQPLEKQLVGSLVCYRDKCSSNSSTSQLILPDSLKCLPVLIQAFLKKINLEKAWLIGCNVEQTLRYFYPRMISLSDYVINSDILKTKSLNLSVTSLTEDDIYILENSSKIFIYVPKGVDRMLVESLFVEGPEGLSVRECEQEECVILNSIIQKISEHYNQELKINICLAGQSLSEGEFISNMVEDTINNVPDYIDYIFKLHFQIQKQ